MITASFMKKGLFTLVVGLVFFFSSTRAQSFYPIAIPEKTQRILFLGNSITYAGHYVDYVVAYLHLKYPDRDFEFINLGLPSETVSGLSEPGHADGKFPRPDLHDRLERILERVEPDLVFSCYGMNDGIYQPFDQGRFMSYQEGIQKLHLKVTGASIPIIHLTPPVYDPDKGKEYAEVLGIYTKWLLDQRNVFEWQVIDLHNPMKEFLLKERKQDPAFFLAKDGVHPGELGHWLMAREILFALGHKDICSYSSYEEYFGSLRGGLDVLKLVSEYQLLTKDAWLTAIGHERPGMKVGLSLGEARTNACKLQKEIYKLIRD